MVLTHIVIKDFKIMQETGKTLVSKIILHIMKVSETLDAWI